MNYRTKERRFLLKASTLGAGVLLAACSSSAPGSVPIAPIDAGPDAESPLDGAPPGTVAHPPDGGDASVGPCSPTPCGVIAIPPDGGDASDQ
jgi:hypothetical protein